MNNEFCPNGNFWVEITGVFDSRTYYFCDCNLCKGQVYELRPIKITHKICPEKIKNLRKRQEIEKLKRKINFENMDKVKEVLDNTKHKTS